MPEGVEIELYRRAAEVVVGRTITTVHAPDSYFIKGGATAKELKRALTGGTVTSTGRVGKLLLIGVDGHPAALGLRFGMTGRLVVDDAAAIEVLEYSSARDDAAWDRFALDFDVGGSLRINDPRRLGGVELEPDPDTLGVDLFDATPARLRAALHSSAPLKARLLDQKRIAGIGNLIADEVLWAAGLSPGRAARSLTDNEVRRLSRTIRRLANRLFDQGGSHSGPLFPARVPGGLCPRDGSPLQRNSIGGRTTYWCPHHQV